MTVGELRKALEGMADDMPVAVENQGDSAVASEARLVKTPETYMGVWDAKLRQRIVGDVFWVGV